MDIGNEYLERMVVCQWEAIIMGRKINWSSIKLTDDGELDDLMMGPPGQ